MKKLIYIATISLAVMLTYSCDTVYLDPNSTLEPDVTSSPENLAALINGVQQRWSAERSGGIYNTVNLSGLATKELRLLNPGNLAENEALLGGADISGDNEILTTLWNNSMLCRKEATLVIDAADEATGGDASAANTLKAYGLFYRALVHGTLVQYFDEVPIDIVENSAFMSRGDVLSDAITDLETASGYVSSGLASSVTANIFDSVDLGNSIQALLARFNIMAGNNDQALTAANNVDLGAKSTWRYDAAIPNPLAFWFGSQNVTQARDLKFGLPDDLLPDPDDQRIAFYTDQPDPMDPSNFQIKGFFTDNLDEIPVYLPGEIMLIKAEAQARNGNMAEAISELNMVLTKNSGDDAFGIGAGLAAYDGDMTADAILMEIYRNRRIELYLTGSSLEDTRRFNRPDATAADAERNRNYYPYPNSERDNNTQTPPNPPN